MPGVTTLWRQPCPDCGREVVVYRAKAADGHVPKIRHHEKRRTHRSCPASGMVMGARTPTRARQVVQSDARVATAIVDRWLAGEGVNDLAKDYRMPSQAIAVCIGAARDMSQGRRKKVVNKLLAQWAEERPRSNP